MKIGAHDLNKDVLIVAEIGNNHEGSVTRAEDMIGMARDAGAHAVKFQTFKAERYVSASDAARFTRLKRFELSESEFARLHATAERLGVIFLSTPFDIDSARFLSKLVPAFKIASGDNNHKPLLEAVAAFGKPIILSTGLTDLAGIRKSRAIIDRVWKDKGIRQEQAALHCVSGYPVPETEANLGAITQLQQTFGGVVGYSDHCVGIEAAIIAVAIGARIIEKHFTFNKNYSDFRDHQLSADPQEFATMVQRIGEVRSMIGRAEKRVQDCEAANARPMRRSISARRNIPRGSLIELKDIDWIRPGTGIPPGEEFRVIGKRTTCDLAAGEIIDVNAVGAGGI